MNQMPAPFVFSHAQLLVMLLSVVIGVLIMMGFVVWAAKHAYRERRRIRCPVRLRMAKVLFELSPDGRLTDVLRCGIFENQPPRSCGKACLYVTAT